MTYITVWIVLSHCVGLADGLWTGNARRYILDKRCMGMPTLPCGYLPTASPIVAKLIVLGETSPAQD